MAPVTLTTAPAPGSDRKALPLMVKLLKVSVPPTGPLPVVTVPPVTVVAPSELGPVCVWLFKSNLPSLLTMTVLAGAIWLDCINWTTAEFGMGGPPGVVIEELTMAAGVVWFVPESKLAGLVPDR